MPDLVKRSLVAVRASVPQNAFTADSLGTIREGSGAVIDSTGLVVTIGYLITEAEEIWLTTHDGRVLPAHSVGYDQETGFGLVQALGTLDCPALEIGTSANVRQGDTTRIIDGRQTEVITEIVARQPFAGYWEYMLEEALFTGPSHPSWGGSALIDAQDRLIGIGSLRLEMMRAGVPTEINMVVPIDLLKPILEDLKALGRAQRDPRPWLGVFSAETSDGVIVMSVADGGPAEKAGLRNGDVINELDGTEILGLSDFYKCLWTQGPVGAEFAIGLIRDGRQTWVRVTTADRDSFLLKHQMQ